jgi:hypothetical protein
MVIAGAAPLASADVLRDVTARAGALQELFASKPVLAGAAR